MSMPKPVILPPAEVERRRAIMHRALAQVRLEGLEPDALFFDYAERYAQGAMTLAEAITDFKQRIAAHDIRQPI